MGVMGGKQQACSRKFILKRSHDPEGSSRPLLLIEQRYTTSDCELLTWKAAHKAAPKHVFLSKAVNDRLGPASLTA